jgi:putative peptide zinc metalloprotease protein
VPARAPRIRSDLVFSRVVQRGTTSFIVKDPLTGVYMRLDEMSGTIAQQMDGRRSLEDLVAWANRQWPGVAFDLDYLDDLARELKQLRYIEDPFDRSALVMRKARAERAQLSWSTFRNIMQIELGIVDPDAFLDRTMKKVAFAFKQPVVLGVLAAFLLSCLVLWARRDHLFPPAEFFAFPGATVPVVLALWVLMLATTMVHELGHAYAVKNFGGRVNRMGTMLMFGLPCLFCDVSDSHLFTNWKHKIYVALGGIYADVVMAVVATALWWATADGTMVNEFASRIMLFCGIMGIAMNANPLIKLDGYFVLAEYLEMPELREHSFRYAGYLLRRYLLGVPLESPVAGRARKRILLGYVVLAFLYTAILMVLFYLWVRDWMIDNWGFVGALAALAVLWWFFKRPIELTWRSLRESYLTHRARLARGRAAWGALAVLVLVAALLVPVPGVITQPVVLMPARLAAVSAPDELFLRESRFSAGDEVRAGDTLALLDARQFQVDARQLERLALGQQRQAWAASHQGADAQARGAELMRRAYAGEARESRRRAERAVLRAPFDGRVLSLSARDRLGDRLAAGETLCVVGDTRRLRAGLYLSEELAADLVPGSRARARAAADPSLLLRGRVASVEWDSREVEGARHYLAWLELEGGDGRVRAGQTALARVHTPPRSLASHFVRWLARWLRADLMV